MTSEFTVRHTLPNLIREARRERMKRLDVYPRLVEKGKLRKGEAEELIAMQESIIAQLEADYARDLAQAHAENPGQRRVKAS